MLFELPKVVPKWQFGTLFTSKSWKHIVFWHFCNVQLPKAPYAWQFLTLFIQKREKQDVFWHFLEVETAKSGLNRLVFSTFGFQIVSTHTVFWHFSEVETVKNLRPPNLSVFNTFDSQIVKTRRVLTFLEVDLPKLTWPRDFLTLFTAKLWKRTVY